MSKLKKNIRQSLINSGGVKKYLLYALGEILLIMIGVLLAFQVSSWKEKSNNKNAELTYYKNIRRQLNEDLGIINRNIEYNKRYLGQFNFAIQSIEANNRRNMDTLVDISLNLFRYSDFHRASNIYETIVNSGQIKLLQNQHILERLMALEETYVYVNKMEDIHLDIIKQMVVPDLVRMVEFSSHKVEKPNELYSFQFKNRFTFLVEIMKEKDDVYHKATNEITKLIELIDEELDAKNDS